MNILEQTVKRIRPLDSGAVEKACQRQAMLTKPRGSLGLLEDISIKLAGIQASPFPAIHHKVIITMAADHGVVSEGISLYPQEVTRQMVLNFLNGGAAIDVLARQIDARLVIVDMGVIGGFPHTPGLICRMIDFGTQNMCLGPAMTTQQVLACLETGIEIVEAEIERGLDIIGTGDMGIGNTTAASAIIATLTGEPVSKVTGRGTGIDDQQLALKIRVIQKALQVNQPDPGDAIDVLAKVGGFEIGGLAGLMLAGAAHRIPVVIDGFISGAAALIATRICPAATDYLIASHLSAENGHSICLNSMGLKPLLNLNMRLGEGTGSALGIFLVESAANILTQMATFESANVTDITSTTCERQ
ncbi:MAG: nicotinate-nucleotide--dimethylbenzimidazole phosphoribosyltransferase [Dehalococcoidia bacterium]|nr:nicotinate-nucleotide--dimethylbenzimidazole phosphoribosyltransferase [Dehalococcoidia bacterium]MDD5493120.1 nicotinate-nucleotide--dimethylbenzimidazole phosphoribosyltransferase [Dehalococcoidia bacterium]